METQHIENLHFQPLQATYLAVIIVEPKGRLLDNIIPLYTMFSSQQ